MFKNLLYQLKILILMLGKYSDQEIWNAAVLYIIKKNINFADSIPGISYTHLLSSKLSSVIYET